MTFNKTRFIIKPVRQNTYKFMKGVITIKITIEAARVNKHLTQEEAGAMLGVSRVTISNWESGKSLPSLKNVKRLSDLYEIPVDNLDFLSSCKEKL